MPSEDHDMTLIQTILIVVASLILVKSIVVCLIPHQMIKISKPFIKNASAMRKGGVIGIIIALVLFVIANLL